VISQSIGTPTDRTRDAQADWLRVYPVCTGSVAVHVCPGVNLVTVHVRGVVSVTLWLAEGLTTAPGQDSVTVTGAVLSGMKFFRTVKVVEFSVFVIVHGDVTP
jgi:hypothetical protein